MLSGKGVAVTSDRTPLLVQENPELRVLYGRNSTPSCNDPNKVNRHNLKALASARILSSLICIKSALNICM